MIKFDRLFQILKERGISQYHLYTYKGISRSQIQRLKTGNVNVNTLNNILNVLEDCESTKCEEIRKYHARRKRSRA